MAMDSFRDLVWVLGGSNFEGIALLIVGSSLSHPTCAGLMNDLWQWDPKTNFWTWSSGSQNKGQPGIYGLFQQRHEMNVAGARYYHTMEVQKISGLLMLFGGQGYDSNGNEGMYERSSRYR